MSQQFDTTLPNLADGSITLEEANDQALTTDERESLVTGLCVRAAIGESLDILTP